jgi:tRNA nucleotidyltransferase (CCA-adding enzyme)
MRVITTHQNADFDGLAAMIAAQKLYPDALLVFSGSQERNVREFTSQSLLYNYDFHKVKDINLEAITSLILVDTRSSERIGPFADCLGRNPGLTLHIYDHHLYNPGDLSGEVEVIKDYGSTTTILINLLQERQIPITANEATIFALGIYEDTGSLTHLTTTPEDLMAAAWLLQQGAKLDQVAQFLTHELTSTQIGLLHELMKSARQYTIQDIPIAVVTHSLSHYVDEFALIVRRFMAMENLNVLFALISMAGRIYLIARSRIADVNVGIIARDLRRRRPRHRSLGDLEGSHPDGGRGKTHPRPAPPYPPQPIASEMMSKPGITVAPDTTIAEAQALLTRYNITSAPVRQRLRPDPAEGHAILGIITRQILKRRRTIILADRPVSEYMSTEVRTLPLNATLADIQELIIENRQRLIPIVENDALMGVITRTDLLNRLVNDPAHLPKDLLHEAEHPSLASNAQPQLPAGRMS